jgi:hypothetical protein
MDIPHFETCFVFLSPGVTVGASGFGFVNGHIVRIPGNNPEDFRHIEVGMAMAQSAEHIADKTLRAEMLTNATKLIAIGRAAIEAKLKNANIGKAEAA